MRSYAITGIYRRPCARSAPTDKGRCRTRKRIDGTVLDAPPDLLVRQLAWHESESPELLQQALDEREHTLRRDISRSELQQRPLILIGPEGALRLRLFVVVGVAMPPEVLDD